MSVIRFQRSLTEGSCIFLVFLPCIDFILTFLGCIRAGLVAVPVYPPSTYHRLHHNQTLRKSKRTFSCFLESSKTVKPKSRYVTSFLSFFSPLQRVHEDQARHRHESPLHCVGRPMAGLGMDQPQFHSGNVFSSRRPVRFPSYSLF